MPFFEAISLRCEQRVASMETFKEKLLKLNQTPKQKKSQNLKTMCLAVLAHQILKISLAFFVSFLTRKKVKISRISALRNCEGSVTPQLFILSKIRFSYKSSDLGLNVSRGVRRIFQ